MSHFSATDCDTRSVVAAEEEGLQQQQSICKSNSIKVSNMRAATPYLCALFVATAGHQGNLLGSDEQEIVLLIYVVVDMTTNTVIVVIVVFLKVIIIRLSAMLLFVYIFRTSLHTDFCCGIRRIISAPIYVHFCFCFFNSLFDFNFPLWPQ